MTEYFAIVTISKPMSGGGGFAQGTFTCTVNVRPNATREAIYKHVLDKVPGQFKGGNVVFYSAEPNRVTAGVAS